MGSLKSAKLAVVAESSYKKDATAQVTTRLCSLGVTFSVLVLGPAFTCCVLAWPDADPGFALRVTLVGFAGTVSTLQMCLARRATSGKGLSWGRRMLSVRELCSTSPG